jgi:hypothetical protein
MRLTDNHERCVALRCDLFGRALTRDRARFLRVSFFHADIPDTRELGVLLFAVFWGLAAGTAIASGQSCEVERLTNPIPRTSCVYLIPSLTGGGYAPLAYRAEGGSDLEGIEATVRALGAGYNRHGATDAGQARDAEDEGEAKRDERFCLAGQANPEGYDLVLRPVASSPANHGRFVEKGGHWSGFGTSNCAKDDSRAQSGGRYYLFARALHGCITCPGRNSLPLDLNQMAVSASASSSLCLREQNASCGGLTSISAMRDSMRETGFVPPTLAIERNPNGRWHTLDRNFILFHTISTMALFADIWTTERAQPKAIELNPLFGRHPTPARVYSIAVPLHIFFVYRSYRAKKLAPRRSVWKLTPRLSIAVHTAAAINNLVVARQ